MEDDRTYFARRAAEERSAATSADGKARQAHLELAERYQQLIGSDEVQEPVALVPEHSPAA